MGLVNCRECDAEVSNQAKKCPYCGIPRPGLATGSSGWAVGVGLFLIIAMCTYMERRPEPTSSVVFTPPPKIKNIPKSSDKAHPPAKRKSLSLLEQAARDVRAYELAKKRQGALFLVRSAANKKHSYTQAQCDKLSDQGKMVRFWDVIKLLIKRYPEGTNFPHVGQGLTYSRRWHLIQCGKWRYALPIVK